jgi:aspartate aminotransferase/aminotransferase
MFEPGIASRIDRLTRSGIRAVMELAAERERKGERILHLEVGQPDFATPAHIIEAVAKAMRDGLAGYTPNAGLLSLRQAVADRVAERSGRQVPLNCVCITSGAVMALALALISLVDPGDEVLVPDPGWPNYRSAVTLSGGDIVPFRLDPARNFAPDLAEIESLITARTKALMINSPGNPTGAVMTAEQVRALVEFTEARGIYLISDEVYEDFVFGVEGHSTAYQPGAERVILVSGASKSFAMTGWRIGWLVADPRIAAASAALVEPLTSCPPTISQVAAEVAVRGPQDSVEAMRVAYAHRAALATRLLEPSGRLLGEPAGAFYAMVKVADDRTDDDDFARRLLAEQSVAVAPGSTFGESVTDAIRISLASPEAVIEEAIGRILQFCELNSQMVLPS